MIFFPVGNIELVKLQAVDISALCVHPACVTSVTLTSLRTEPGRGRDCNSESMVLNVSGRLLMVQREKSPPESGANAGLYTCTMPTVLASCVENVWVPGQRKPDKVHLTEALWLFCGSHGMRVWLPLFPRDGDKAHTFMSKRIMLPFHLKIYPLAILFEDAIILGAENDTVLYTSDSNSPFSLPFSVLERTVRITSFKIIEQCVIHFVLEPSVLTSDIATINQTKFRISRLGDRSELYEFTIFPPFFRTAFT